MTPRARIAILAVAVAALVAAFFVARGTDDDSSNDRQAETPTVTVTAPPGDTAATAPSSTTTTPARTAAPPVPVVAVVGGRPQGGIKKLSFDKGDQIRFKVRSDTADEVHVHGYDLEKAVPAGGTATFSFPGRIDGRFEVELHHSGQQIASLEVQP